MLTLGKQQKVYAKAPQRPELFIIPPEVVEACSFENIESTVRDMYSLDIARMPVSNLYLRMPIRTWIKYMETAPTQLGLDVCRYLRRLVPMIDASIQFHIRNNGIEETTIFLPPGSSPMKDKHEWFANGSEEAKAGDVIINYASRLLIGLLATKNIRKDREHNKLAKLGIGKNRFAYTTTLRLPSEFGSEAACAYAARTGHPIRPHLRRGHKRDQWFPSEGVHKPIWIEPCFVNADGDFVSARSAYQFAAE